MSLKFLHITLSVFFMTAVNSAANAADALAEKAEYIEPDNAALKAGRNIWLQNCENCHGYGIADAPIPMQPDDWKPRVSKGKALLYNHAIEGFIGESYSMMPARGGNDDLDDKQVKAAVDYMLFLANYYIDQLDNKR